MRKSSNVYVASGSYTPSPPGSPGPQGPLPPSVQKITYSFAVRGGWFNLLRFINMLETQKRIINVDSITITPGGNDEKLTTTPRRELGIRITSYMYREAPPPPDPNAPTAMEQPKEPREKPADTIKTTSPPD